MKTKKLTAAWFLQLSRATPAEREQFEVSCTGLHWEAINDAIG